IGELIALSRRQIEQERETGVGQANAGTGETSQVVEIDDDLLAEAGLRRSLQKHVARRHFNRLARELALRFEHVAAKQRYGHALKASAFRNLERRLWIRRHARQQSLLVKLPMSNEVNEFALTRNYGGGAAPLSVLSARTKSFEDQEIAPEQKAG